MSFYVSKTKAMLEREVRLLEEERNQLRDRLKMVESYVDSVKGLTDDLIQELQALQERCRELNDLVTK